MSLAGNNSTLSGQETPLYPSLATQPLEDVLRLIRSEHVGPITFFQLIQRYKTAAKALKALPMLALRGGAKRTIQVCPEAKANEEIERTRRYGGFFIPYGHAHYPKWLMQIPDAPPLLISHGHPHLLNHKPVLAMVGSRNASANGCRFAQKLAKELGEVGYLIASGLARGIDAYAHQGALASGTIGVIAGGIDHVYPQENKGLYQLLQEQGVIITESPFGSAPQHRHFPARNRIIAGMSLGTIVVEATSKSGSLITATYALEYHRDIFAVPGFPLDPRSAGANQLIQQGAMLVNSAHDIVDYLLNRPYHVEDSGKQQHFFHQLQEVPGEQDENLDRERAELAQLIGYSPIAVEELIVISGIEARIIHVLLLEMELAGVITRYSGGRICRVME